MSALLTIAETAHALNVSTRTIRRLIADHQLRIVKVRGSTRVSADEVARYAKARERLG